MEPLEDQAQPWELRHCQSPALGLQDGPAETHQHHPTGPQKASPGDASRCPDPLRKGSLAQEPQTPKHPRLEFGIFLAHGRCAASDQ